jgi:teichuronic acid biosynthesis glycosyltransferase TuaC
VRVLYITNMYPSKEHSYNGIHVKEQIDCIVNRYKIEHEIYFINGLQSKWNYAKSIFSINKKLAESNYDLIHIHFGLSGLFSIINPFIKIPIVLTIHGSDINSNKKWGMLPRITKMVIPRVQRLIILNDKMADLLIKYKEKLAKIPCGINIDQFAVERTNIGKSFVIGFPGDKLRPVKNYPFFKTIIKEFSKNRQNIEEVEFHNLSRKEVAANLSKLDCLLMTSHSEGSPQIIKEAMACGIPIVTANVGDVGFILKDVEHCFVIDSYNAQSYVEALIHISKLTPMNQKTNGKERLKLLGLDQDSVCLNVYNLYKDVLKLN